MDENTRDDQMAAELADALEEHWKDLAREFLDSLDDERPRWRLAAAKTLSLLLEQEYKRGYNAGHDDGFDEGLCK